jgi:phospholipid transport system substrate-binding protein
MTWPSRPRVRVALVLAAVLVVASPAAGVAPTGELRAMFDEANRVLNEPAPEARPVDRLSAVLEVVDRVFAFRGAAQLALGREWELRSAAEREEFVELFSELLQRTFVLTVASRASLESGGPEIRYLGESISGDAATVFTTMLLRDGTALPVEYRMIRRGDGWAVLDVVWDGVSLVGNYRAQFLRVMRASSYRELVARMTARSSEVTTLLPFARAEPGGHQPARAASSPPPAESPIIAAGDGAPVRVEPLGGAGTPSAPPVAGQSHMAGREPVNGESNFRALPRSEPAGPRSPSRPVASAPGSLASPPPAGGRREAPDGSPRPVEREGRAGAVAAAGPSPADPPRVFDGDEPDTAATGELAGRPAAVGTAGAAVGTAGAAVAARPPEQIARAGASDVDAAAATRRALPARPVEARRTKPDGTRATAPTYWVQVGAFRSAETARAVAEELLAQRRAISMEGAEAKAGDRTVRIIRVRVGPFADRSTASTTQRDLARQGHAAFVAVERD